MGRVAAACPNCAMPLRLPPGRAGRPVRCPHCGGAFAAPPGEGGAVEFFDSLPAPTVTGRSPRPGESIFDESGGVGGDQPTERLVAPLPPGDLARTARLPQARLPLPAWVRPALAALGAYALLATAVAARGWLR